MGHLQHATFGDHTQQWRKSDKTGNLFNTEDKQGIEYSKGNRLNKWHGWTFEYDDDGNLIEKYKGGRGWFSSKEERWQYKWDAFGMLKEVKRPDKKKVTFTYDALGRRLTKHFSRTTTHFLWSGNVPLHEWKETFEFNYSTGLYDLGTEHSPTTWIFEAGSFVPCGKIVNGKHYSIITDHLGTPIEAYNQEGELIWEREQDLYGNSRQGFAKENFRCPFKYQGQYYDPEIELCYNRFRYYHPEMGRYISEDPIKLLGGFNVFAYVSDTNAWVDVLGLNGSKAYERGNKRLQKFREKGTLDEASNGHLDKHQMEDSRIKEIIDNPDAIFYNSNNTNLTFYKDGDVVIVNTNENKLVTSFGASDKDGTPVNLSDLESRNGNVQIE